MRCHHRFLSHRCRQSTVPTYATRVIIDIARISLTACRTGFRLDSRAKRRILLMHNHLRTNLATIGTSRAYRECQTSQISPNLKGYRVMKRVAWILTVLGILCLATGQAQAHDWHHGGHHGYHGAYYGGYYGPVVVRPQVCGRSPSDRSGWLPRQRWSIRRCTAIRYYEPVPSAGFYYRSRGLSIGVGW